MRSLVEALSGAGSHAANTRYLASLKPQEKDKILKHVADHYGISTKEAEEELLDVDAENVYEYLASDRALATSVYRAFKALGL